MGDVRVLVLQSFCGTREQNQLYGNGSVVESVETAVPWARLTDPKESYKSSRQRIIPMPEKQALELEARKCVKILPDETPQLEQVSSDTPKSGRKSAATQPK